MQFTFGPLAPDAGANTPGVCMEANGVLPLVEGYGPAPQIVTPSTATALPANPRGALTTITRAGVTKVFFFTEATVQELGTDYTWTQIEAALSCTAGDDWSAIQFGNLLLYTNTTQGLRAYNIESGGAASAVSGVAPREIFVCGNLIFGLDCLDRSGARDNRLIRNSDFNSHTNWTTGAADYQPLESGGELIAGVSLNENTAIVFQRSAMRLIRVGNAGGGAMYSLSEISTERGSVGRKSIIGFDGVAYGLSANGFFRFSLGGGLENIGAGLVDEWFLSQVAVSRLDDVQGTVYPSKKIVLWRYPTASDASQTVTENVIGYSWAFNRWFTMSVDLTYMSRISTPGYTLATADAAFNTIGDAPAIPIGDPFWQGGALLLAGLDDDLKFTTFAGAAQAATIETSISNSPVSTLIGWATPIDDASGGTLALGVTDELADALTWKTGAAKVSGGRTPQRGRGLNIAFRREIPAGEIWTYAKGVDHIRSNAGGPK
jgi:hypothetical protein